MEDIKKTRLLQLEICYCSTDKLEFKRECSGAFNKEELKELNKIINEFNRAFQNFMVSNFGVEKIEEVKLK